MVKTYVPLPWRYWQLPGLNIKSSERLRWVRSGSFAAQLGTIIKRFFHKLSVRPTSHYTTEDMLLSFCFKQGHCYNQLWFISKADLSANKIPPAHQTCSLTGQPEWPKDTKRSPIFWYIWNTSVRNVNSVKFSDSFLYVCSNHWFSLMISKLIFKNQMCSATRVSWYRY